MLPLQRRKPECVNYSRIAPSDSNFLFTDKDFFQSSAHDSDADMQALDALYASIICDEPALAKPPAPEAPELALPDFGQQLQAAREAADEFEPNAERMRVRPVIRSAEEQAEIDVLIADAGLNDFDAADAEPTSAARALLESIRPHINWKLVYDSSQAEKRRRRYAPSMEAKATARRDADRERKRASPKLINEKRLKALLKATANPKGDKTLEKLRGREFEIVQFRDAMSLASDATDAELGDLYGRLTGSPMNKRQAQNRRNKIEKLEAPDGIWSRLK